MFEIKKCGDCIHADVCEHNPSIPLFNRANAAFCEGFKDRNELIEVVRCKDCKHCDFFYPTKEIGKKPIPAWYCRPQKSNRKPNDYCSYGERKDND